MFFNFYLELQIHSHHIVIHQTNRIHMEVTASCTRLVEELKSKTLVLQPVECHQGLGFSALQLKGWFKSKTSI